MSRAFDRANRLWLREGRTAAALQAYARAVAERPDDPVVALQYAAALRAVDRGAEADELARRCRRLAAGLDPDRRETLLALLPAAEEVPARTYPQYAPGDLDRDRLAVLPDSADWRTIADAADQRGMPGVVEYALQRWDGAPIDAEDARDLSLMRGRGALRAGALRELAAGPRRPPGAPAADARERLRLDVRVAPATTAVGTPVTVLCTLRNRGPEPVCVNGRLLVTHPGLPGEITLAVTGPPGYRNRTEFQVNAGAPAEASFVDLPAGGEVRSDLELTTYQSLDVPGDYTVAVTYRNDIDRAPGGRPVVVGELTASAAFQRSAPVTAR